MAKTAKKAASKKSTANARTRISEDSKIVVKIKENPAREGTTRFKNVARIMKHNGKKVAEFVKHGGKVASLSFSKRQGWISIA